MLGLQLRYQLPTYLSRHRKVRWRVTVVSIINHATQHPLVPKLIGKVGNLNNPPIIQIRKYKLRINNHNVADVWLEHLPKPTASDRRGSNEPWKGILRQAREWSNTPRDRRSAKMSGPQAHRKILPCARTLTAEACEQVRILSWRGTRRTIKQYTRLNLSVSEQRIRSWYLNGCRPD